MRRVGCTLTPVAGIEQSCLETNCAHVLEALVNGDVHGVAVVRVGVREGEEVGGSDKEVAVEGV